jgi:hypothetical protein
VYVPRRGVVEVEERHLESFLATFEGSEVTTGAEPAPSDSSAKLAQGEEK